MYQVAVFRNLDEGYLPAEHFGKLSAGTADEVDYAIGSFFVHVDVVGAIRKDPLWAKGQKYKVSASGYVSKILTYESRVETQKVEY